MNTSAPTVLMQRIDKETGRPVWFGARYFRGPQVEPDTVERRLSAILFGDIVGFSRLIEADEKGVLQRQRQNRREVIDPLTQKYNGRIVKLIGDGILIEFASIVDAVQCAADIQTQIQSRDLDLETNKRIRYRIGVNLGDVVVDDNDILGDAVNIAARLEALAPPGGICISEMARDNLTGKTDLDFEDIGEQSLKNISRSVRAYRVRINTDDEPVTPTRSQPGKAEKPSIAVLAFNNMSGDPDQEYFSDGLTEDIITGLSRNKNLLVIARNTSFTYKGQAVDVKRVGKELGVRYVMVGSVRRGGDRVRITGQLIDARTGGHVWADRYDGKMDDVFELQDEFTAKVLGAVGTEITLAEIDRAQHQRASSLHAWDRYLQALPHYYNIDKAGHEETKRLLNEAIEIDPRFSGAYALLALSYIHAAHHAWEEKGHEAAETARELAQKAITLDPEDPLARAALGRYYMFNTQPARSVEELRMAVDLDPNLSSAYGMLCNSLGFLGRVDEALEAFAEANRGSPRDPERYFWHVGVMISQFANSEYEACVEAGAKAILLKPNFYGAYFITTAALALLGRLDEARRHLSMALTYNPRLNLDNTARNPMFARDSDVKRLLDGLQQAGLPKRDG